MNFYSSVKNTVLKGKSEYSRSAAAFLVNGNSYSDCAIEPMAIGPFNLHCIQNEALKNRYQYDGTKFPKSNADIKMFENMSWIDIQEYFILRAKELDSNDSFIVQKASLELLGIKINPEVYDFGSLDGISYYMYEWVDQKNPLAVTSNSKDDNLGIFTDLAKWGLDNEKTCPNTSTLLNNKFLLSNEISMNENKYIYIGRKIGDSFPDFDIKKKKNSQENKRKVKSMVRFKGQMVSDIAFDTRFWTYIDNGIRIQVNNENILDKWASQAEPVVFESNVFTVKNNADNFNNDKSKKNVVSESTQTTKYDPLNNTNFLIDWYNISSRYAFYLRFWQHNKFIPIPSQLLRQTQPTKFPIARWDFYQGTIEDRCKILTVQVVGQIPITVIGYKKCALFKGPENFIKINSGIHIDGFKSITMMVNLREAPKDAFRFWEFCNNKPNEVVPNANSCMKDVFLRDELYGAMSQRNKDGIGFCCNFNNTGPRIWSQSNITIDINEWCHLAWVIEDDLSGMSLYLNGNVVATYNHPIIELRNKIYKYMYILHSNEKFDKNIGVAWFRIFDYALKPVHVYMDMTNQFARESAYPTNTKSGW